MAFELPDHERKGAIALLVHLVSAPVLPLSLPVLAPDGGVCLFGCVFAMAAAGISTRGSAKVSDAESKRLPPDRLR